LITAWRNPLAPATLAASRVFRHPGGPPSTNRANTLWTRVHLLQRRGPARRRWGPRPGEGSSYRNKDLEQNLVGSWFDADLHLGHHLGSGRPRQSDGSVAAVRHDDVAGPLSISEQVGLW